MAVNSFRSHEASPMIDASWNVMAHAQKPDFVFCRSGRVHLNRRGRQFSPILAAGVCVSEIVMLDTLCSKVVWRVLAAHSIRQFPLHFPSLRHRVPSHFNWSLPCVSCGNVSKFVDAVSVSTALTPRSRLPSWATGSRCLIRCVFHALIKGKVHPSNRPRRPRKGADV